MYHRTRSSPTRAMDVDPLGVYHYYDKNITLGGLYYQVLTIVQGIYIFTTQFACQEI